MSSSTSRREAARSGELGRMCGADGPPPRPAHAPVRSGELMPKGGGPDAAAAAVRHEGWMVRYGRRKIGRSFFHTRYFVLDNKLLAYYKKQPNDNNMERSLSQSPRSPGAVAGAPFLSICVTDPVKMGTGVQSYISYRVITKVLQRGDAGRPDVVPGAPCLGERHPPGERHGTHAGSGERRPAGGQHSACGAPVPPVEHHGGGVRAVLVQLGAGLCHTSEKEQMVSTTMKIFVNSVI